ncbi:ABC transporter substrate-binding protein [Bdellovibrionota bacterium FG-1]
MHKISALALALLLFLSANGCHKAKNEIPNTLHQPISAKIKGLDPAFADDLYSGQQISLTYEGLLQYSYLKRPFVLEPNLAVAMPQVSADGKTYTVRLKSGVLFQDDPCFKETQGKGRELTADDFIYSWKRIADSKTSSTGWWIFDGQIVGLNEWREAGVKTDAADYSKPVEGFKALDRYTLQIKLIKPSAQFLFHLAQQFSFVVAKEAVDFYGREFLNHAVGTGPFRLQEFNGASKIVWLRNPTFRRVLYPSEGAPGDQEAGLLHDAGKPLPFLDKIVTQIFEERQPMWLSFLSGKLDFSEIPKDNFDQVIDAAGGLKPEMKAKSLVLTKTAAPEFTRYVFNMADPLLGKNKLLRQALSLAYDSPSAIRIFYNGRALPAQGPIPPGIEGYDEKLQNPYRQVNVTKAKELLAKAGYPGGKDLPPLEYVTLADSLSRQWTEYDQKQFSQLGIKLKINTYSWPEYNAAIKNRRGQVFAGGAWTGDYPDAENFFQLFYSKNGPPGPNDGSYASPEFDKLFEKSLTLSASPARTAIYKQLVQILIEDVPCIFGSHRIIYDLFQPWLKNFKRNSFDLGRYKYLRIDK